MREHDQTPEILNPPMRIPCCIDICARLQRYVDTDSRSRLIAALALVVGAALGMAGTFAPSASLRGLAWGVDGTALVLASALLTVRYFRRGNDFAAAGFLVFVVGEALILSGAAMDLVESVSVFGAGVALWATSLALVGASGVMPRWVNGVGYVGAVLFTVVALQIFAGYALTPLSQPLPFVAYPFLVATLVGWAWVQYRDV
jgi:hypothetical protein